ncbi:MAG TPA: RluA family pseudouridine synthase [Candidatus Omnitrophica bacterium]|nr:RluA family pseudouridine synthase [Candidatus Omnitrophota bacterium]
MLCLQKIKKFNFQGSPQRLDLFLHSQLKDFSRQQVKKLIKSGKVYVNWQSVFKPGLRVKTGDVIEVRMDGIISLDKIIPQPLPLDIIYEDNDIIVINKPPGILVHPTAIDKTQTLANALVYHFQNLSDIYGPLKPGIVHRLDKDTSGILVVAKNNYVHLKLSKQFANREIIKKYLAVVEGRIETDVGKICQPIARGRLQRKKMKVDYSRGRWAETIYKVLATAGKQKDMSIPGLHSFSFVLLYPKTGRTHQLRVHMRYIGHPIVGDAKYSKKSKLIPRQALHAYSLKFKHPTTGQFQEFIAPLPQDFQILLEKIGIKNWRRIISST